MSRVKLLALAALAAHSSTVRAACAASAACAVAFFCQRVRLPAPAVALCLLLLRAGGHAAPQTLCDAAALLSVRESAARRAGCGQVNF